MPQIKIEFLRINNYWWSRVEILGGEDGSCRLTPSPSRTAKDSLMKALELIDRYTPVYF
jgi:hypothetical protein